MCGSMIECIRLFSSPSSSSSSSRYTTCVQPTVGGDGGNGETVLHVKRLKVSPIHIPIPIPIPPSDSKLAVCHLEHIFIWWKTETEGTGWLTADWLANEWQGPECNGCCMIFFHPYVAGVNSTVVLGKEFIAITVERQLGTFYLIRHECSRQNQSWSRSQFRSIRQI